MISKAGMVIALSIVLGVMSGMVLSITEAVQHPDNAIGSFLLSSVLVTLGSLILVAVLYGLYISAYIRRYYYDASEQFLTIQKGVFAPTEIHVPYGKIQDVYVDQDVLDRIMGLYDVHIASATATSGIEAHIDGVDTRVAENLKNTEARLRSRRLACLKIQSPDRQRRKVRGRAYSAQKLFR